MVQVRGSLGTGAARTDLRLPQLARPFRLVLSHAVLRSLRHPFGGVSHRIRRIPECFRGIRLPRQFPTRPSRPNGLLAHFFDVAGSVRRRTRSRCYQGLSHRIRCGRQRCGRSNQPRRVSTPLVGQNGLLGLYFDTVRSFCRRVHPDASRTYSIGFAVVDNLSAAPNTLDAFRCLWVTSRASWVENPT